MTTSALVHLNSVKTRLKDIRLLYVSSCFTQHEMSKKDLYLKHRCQTQNAGLAPEGANHKCVCSPQATVLRHRLRPPATIHTNSNNPFFPHGGKHTPHRSMLLMPEATALRGDTQITVTPGILFTAAQQLAQDSLRPVFSPA